VFPVRAGAGLALIATLAACAVQVSHAATPRPGSCATAKPGTTTLSLQIGGRTRTAIVHVPSGYRGKAVPLVLNLHGSGSTAAAQEAFTGMDATADADTFIVAYPQGAITDGSGFDWNVPNEPLIGGGKVPAGAPNDVAFLVQLVTQLRARYCIDPLRVYATGFSGGARMTSQLGCAATGTFAAVAPVSGLRLPTPCTGTRAVPVVSFHGTADPVDPYNGGGQKYWGYSVPTAAKRWAAHDGCGAKPSTGKPASGVTETTYGSCRSGARVELYTISGEGHEWPGGPTLPRRYTALLGPQSDAVSANAVMWSFFAAHPL